MRIKDIEEVFEAIQEGSYELTDFKCWLALWSVKVLDMADAQKDYDEFFGRDNDNTLSGH
jgi:hypothetical protein